MHDRRSRQGKIGQQWYERLWARFLHLLDKRQYPLSVFIAARLAQFGDPVGFYFELVVHHLIQSAASSCSPFLYHHFGQLARGIDGCARPVPFAMPGGWMNATCTPPRAQSSMSRSL